MLAKTFWIVEDFTARTPILGWCLGALLTTLGARDDAKAAIAKCNNSTISYLVGALFISLSQGYEGLLFALLFASVAGATGGVFGHYTEATTADKVLIPEKATREKLASYLLKDVGVSVMIGVTAGIIVEVINAILNKSLSDSAANFAAVELCAALSVYYSLPADAAAVTETDARATSKVDGGDTGSPGETAAEKSADDNGKPNDKKSK